MFGSCRLARSRSPSPSTRPTTRWTIPRRLRFYDRCSDLMRALLDGLAGRPIGRGPSRRSRSRSDGPGAGSPRCSGGVCHLRQTEFGGRRPYRFQEPRHSASRRWEMSDGRRAGASAASGATRLRLTLRRPPTAIGRTTRHDFGRRALPHTAQCPLLGAASRTRRRHRARLRRRRQHVTRRPPGSASCTAARSDSAILSASCRPAPGSTSRNSSPPIR